MRDPFKKYPSKPHLVSGDLLNKYGETLNAMTGVWPGQVGQAQIVDHQQQVTPPPPWMQGVAIITDASDTCAETENKSGYKETDAPCVKDATDSEGSENRYICQFKYWDFAAPVKQESPSGTPIPYEDREFTGAWRILHDIRMDAGAYWEGDPEGKGVTVGQTYPTDASQTPSSGVGYGAIPKYRVGDNVPCYWDPVRKWLVPIQSPPQNIPRLLVKSSDEQTYTPCPCLIDYGYTEDYLYVTISGVVAKGTDPVDPTPEESSDTWTQPEWEPTEQAFCDCDDCETWNQTFKLFHIPVDRSGNPITNDGDVECFYGLFQEGYDGTYSELNAKAPPDRAKTQLPCALEGDATGIIVKLRCDDNPARGEDDPEKVLYIDMWLIMKSCTVAKWSFPLLRDGTNQGFQEDFSNDYVVTANKVGVDPGFEHVGCPEDEDDISICCETRQNESAFCNNRIPSIIHDIATPDEKEAPRRTGTVEYPHQGAAANNSKELEEFFDFTNCRWSAPSFPVITIPRPEADELDDDSPFMEPCESTASVFLEIKEPGEDIWKSAATLHFRLPRCLDYTFCDSRHNFNVILAKHGTEFRVTWTFRLQTYQPFELEEALADCGNQLGSTIRCKDVLLEFTDVGAYSLGVRDLKACYEKVVRTKKIKTNWEECAEVEPRFRDTASIVIPSGDGVFRVEYEDPLDSSWIGIRLAAILDVTRFIPGPPPLTDESSSSLSTSSKSTSSISSTSSSSESSSQSQESWSSQSSLSSTSTSSQSISSWSSLSSLSSQSNDAILTSADEDYCCVEVVTNIECNPDGTIANVCKKTICFPKIDGISCNDQIQPQECLPCDTDVSSESSQSSSVSSSSISSPSSTSQSSASSTSSSQSQESWSSQSSLSSHSSSSLSSSLSSQSQESWSSQSSSSSASSQSSTSTSSLDTVCVGYAIDPEIEKTGTSATSVVTINSVVQPVDGVSQAHWDAAFLNNQVEITILSNNGAGTLTVNENDGKLIYIPPADGSEAGQDITITLDVCDGDVDAEQSNSSTSSSTISSLSSTSSSTSSTSSVSVSSTSSSPSSASSTSEVSDLSSSSSSTLSSTSSPLSASSVSSTSTSSMSTSSSTASSASSTSTSSISAISSLSSLSTSTLSSTSSISTSSNSSSSSVGGDPQDPCQSCENCSDPPVDCIIEFSINDLQAASALDHTDFTGVQSVGEDINGTFELEIVYLNNAIQYTEDEVLIEFSDAEDLASKVAEFLTSGAYTQPGALFTGFGGVWTVTTTTIDNKVYVTDISGVNAKDPLELVEILFVDEEGLYSVHEFTAVAYIDPYLEAAQTLLTGTIATPSTTPSDCVFLSDTPLEVDGMPDGNMQIEWTISATRIDCVITIYDDQDVEVASCAFEHVRSSGQYFECDKRYVLTQKAGTASSRVGPSNGGPAPDEVADWSGSTAVNMNISSPQFGN